MNTHDIELPTLPVPRTKTDGGIELFAEYSLRDYARAAIKADRQLRGEPDYQISACYFPQAGEVELSWERVCDGEVAHLTFAATPNQGKRLVEVIDPCVYYPATLQPAEPHAEFDDPRVQQVYEIICGDNHPPAGEHWDGYVSRLIVDALFPGEPVKVPSDESIIEFLGSVEAKAADVYINGEWAYLDKLKFARALLARYRSKS